MNARPDYCAASIDLKKEDARQSALDVEYEMREARIADLMPWHINQLSEFSWDIVDELNSEEKDELLRDILTEYKKADSKKTDDKLEFYYELSNKFNILIHKLARQFAEEQA